MGHRKYAIIAGTGMSKLFELLKKQDLKTLYGYVTIYGVKDQNNLFFLPRHGMNYSVPPHKINYRANIFALNTEGITDVIATNAVGSLRKKLSPGSFVLPDQILDFTKNRISTFFEGENGHVVFTDVSQPYSEKVRSAIIKASKRLQIKVYSKATYVCTEGPRYETPAEIRAFKILGADIVGMTSAPEVFLAKELGIEYATIAMITNYAAGMVRSVSHNLILDVMRKSQEKAKLLILESIRILRESEKDR
jgi:5'-methylthioadenosine phosphorylase